jgi:hypothetical protein
MRFLRAGTIIQYFVARVKRVRMSTGLYHFPLVLRFCSHFTVSEGILGWIC